jgi:hypothetical protein
VTLDPTTQQIEGASGPAYKVSMRCAAPDCGKLTEHAHHLYRRSRQGAHDWIKMPDGTIVANKVGLCVAHHDAVTGKIGGHKAWIKWLDGVFVWGLIPRGDPAFPSFFAVGPIDPQPPALDSLNVSQPATETESDVCPTCGSHTRRRPPSPRPPEGERRPKKSWTIKVPADAEDGAEILNAFVDDLAPLLGFDPTASARYYVVNAALVYVEQDRPAFIEAIAGIGGKDG